MMGSVWMKILLHMTTLVTIVIVSKAKEIIMTTMNASIFKATCLALMDKINETGEEIIITKNGRPVSRLLPYRNKPKTLFALHASSIHTVDDLLEPLNESWHVEKS